jgi:hypothetical protein
LLEMNIFIGSLGSLNCPFLLRILLTSYVTRKSTIELLGLDFRSYMSGPRSLWGRTLNSVLLGEPYRQHILRGRALLGFDMMSHERYLELSGEKVLSFYSADNHTRLHEPTGYGEHTFANG